MIGITIIVVTGISVSSLILNQNQPAVAQQQQPRQQQEQALASKDISFDINNDVLTLLWQVDNMAASILFRCHEAIYFHTRTVSKNSIIKK